MGQGLDGDRQLLDPLVERQHRTGARLEEVLVRRQTEGTDGAIHEWEIAQEVRDIHGLHAPDQVRSNGQPVECLGTGVDGEDDPNPCRPFEERPILSQGRAGPYDERRYTSELPKNGGEGGMLCEVVDIAEGIANPILCPLPVGD